jgi:hypothetical protein
MVVFLGVVFWFLINIWATMAVFFMTVPTFGEALFAGLWWQKIIGIILWSIVLFSWYHLASGFSWSTPV